jgi:hypothetical protein
VVLLFGSLLFLAAQGKQPSHEREVAKTNTETPESPKEDPAKNIPDLTSKEPSEHPPKILQKQTWVSEAEAGCNFAGPENLEFSLRMGNEPNSVGIGEAGIEIENARIVLVAIKNSSAFGRHDDNSFAGFIVDYHTADGYLKRVALATGVYSTKTWSTNPGWGKRTVPDRFVDLGRQIEYDLNLQDWAPADWDGRVWFTTSLQNSGRKSIFKGIICLPHEKDGILATRVIGRFKGVAAELPQAKPGHWVFTSNGRAIANGTDIGTWRVRGGKVIIAYAEERWGLAVLEFKDNGTLVGRNEHRNGAVFNWTLRRE